MTGASLLLIARGWTRSETRLRNRVIFSLLRDSELQGSGNFLQTPSQRRLQLFLRSEWDPESKRLLKFASLVRCCFCILTSSHGAHSSLHKSKKREAWMGWEWRQIGFALTSLYKSTYPCRWSLSERDSLIHSKHFKLSSLLHLHSFTLINKPSSAI